MVQNHPMLWVDMKVSRQETESSDAFKKHFHVHLFPTISSLDSAIENTGARVICFDFDFPTKPGLKALQETKYKHPRIPILMLTVQHSEALAVWAFRSRVWDYLVKPIAMRELEHCLIGLREMLEMQVLQQQSRVPAMVRSVIPEENRMAGQRGSAPLALSPAIQYVESNYREKVSSAAAAELCNLTSFQFSRLFKETYGLTFQDYVLRFRIREACRLLKNPTAEIADVAFLVGFNDPSYFGKIFRRYMDCSPSEFLESNQGAVDTDLLLADLDPQRSQSDSSGN